jgi:hypothetical protein
VFAARWIVTLAVLGGLAYGARQLFDTADLRGQQEATDDAARSTGGRNRRSTTTSVPADPAPTTSAAPAVSTTVSGLVAVGPVTPVGLEASGTERDLPDSCGQPVNYSVDNIVDGNLATAWRVPGAGTGATVTFALSGKLHLTEIGLVPGYAKVDLCSNFDRFTQMRRIVAVTWHFDDEVTLPQTFKDRPELQTMPIDVVTSTVTLEIRQTTGNPQLDATAVSEVRLVGAPA